MINENSKSYEVNMNNSVPTPEEFFLKTPIYKGFKLDKFAGKDVLDIEYYQGKLDAYCIDCKRHSIFKSIAKLPQQEIDPHGRAYFPYEDVEHLLADKGEDYALRNRTFSVEFICSRDTSHSMVFYFRVYNLSITKIGQYPSIADFDEEKIRKYRKALGNGKHKEFKKAVGLYAHGIGIGAFVYLRRIFEDLIEQAHIKAAEDPNWNEESYLSIRMDEKITLLRGFLPSLLFENKDIYSILSKGIHTLTEDKCLLCFDTIKNGIELILDEKIAQEQRRKKIEETKIAISKLKSNLKEEE